MGNCATKGSRDVAERSAAAHTPSRHHSESSQSPPPRKKRSSAASTPADKQGKKKPTRTAAAAATNPAATTSGTTTPSGSPQPPRDAAADAKSDKNNNTSTDNSKETNGDSGVLNTKATHDATVSPSLAGKGAEAEKHVTVHSAAEGHNPSVDSIAVRLEQGSTYVWLRYSFANPHLKPTPLLTRETVRRLRNHSVAFQRLWGVLGEAACVLGPYAAAPVLTAARERSASSRNNVKDINDEGDFMAEPSFVNDEAILQEKRDRGSGTAAPPSRRASSSSAGTPAAAATAAAAAAEANVVHEVRMLNQRHINIEGDPTQRHPIICRGAAYRGKHVWIHKLQTRCCFIFEHLSAVDVHDCQDALIVLGPTAGAVSLSNCQGCFVIAAAAQLRVLSCHAMVLSVNVAGFPVIEKSSSIGFAPLLGWYAYSSMSLDFRLAGLSLFTNNYSTVRDVTPPQLLSSSASSSAHPHPRISNASSLSLSLPGGIGGGVPSVSNASVAPGHSGGGAAAALRSASNFVYLDLWELEAAVWKAMAEQRWRQLIAETDAAAATTAATAAAAHASADGTPLWPSSTAAGGNSVAAAAAGVGSGEERDSGAPFLTALSTTGMTPLTGATAGFEHSVDGKQSAADAHRNDNNNKDEDEEEEDADEDELGREHSVDFGDGPDNAFHSMISFGHLSPSTVTKSHIKSSGGSTATASASVKARGPQPQGQAAKATAVGGDGGGGDANTEATTSAVAQLPRWRQAGFAGNVATDAHPPSRGGSLEASLRLRSTVREAEHLVRTVLRSVPLLPLSALRDAPALLLADDDDDDDGADSNHTPQHKKKEEEEKEKKKTKKTARSYNALELTLAMYAHACATPATFGAQVIPADFFEQRWKLKLIVLSVKGGGYAVARRIARDIEASRRRCFLETVHAMLHAPPPSLRNDSTAKDDRLERAKPPSSNGNKSSRRGSVAGAADTLTVDDEDAFSEVMWDYLRCTSLTQRCGSVLLLNTIELRCTETTVREFVAPVFYKLSEPTGLSNSSSNSSGGGSGGGKRNSTNNSGNGGKGLHLPWKSSHTTTTTATASSSNDVTAADSQAMAHNVEMRRLFGTAIQRMTGQTCVAMLALMAPKNVPPSFQRPPGSGGPSIGGALTPAELEAWARRAEDAQSIFAPRKDPLEEVVKGQQQQQGPSQPVNSASEPTAEEEESERGGKAKKAGPTFSFDTSQDGGESGPSSFEERVWPQSVLLNVTVPMRFVSLLQGTLFFKSQVRMAAAAGGAEGAARESENSQ